MAMTLAGSDTLYIRISADKIIFARYDRIKDSTLNYCVFAANPTISLGANMRSALTRVSLAKGDFSIVHVSVSSPVTLVPLNEFDEDDAAELYQYNYPAGLSPQVVYFDTLPRLNAILLFALDRDLANIVTDTYPSATFHSTLTPLVLHFAESSLPVALSGKLFANIDGDMMTLVAFRSSSGISLLNSYRASTIDDKLYYLLSVAKAWKVVAQTDEIYLVGPRPTADQLQEKVRVYLPNCFLVKPEEVFNRHVLRISRELPYDMIILLLRAY